MLTARSTTGLSLVHHRHQEEQCGSGITGGRSPHGGGPPGRIVDGQKRETEEMDAARTSIPSAASGAAGSGTSTTMDQHDGVQGLLVGGSLSSARQSQRLVGQQQQAAPPCDEADPPSAQQQQQQQRRPRSDSFGLDALADLATTMEKETQQRQEARGGCGGNASPSRSSPPPFMVSNGHTSSSSDNSVATGDHAECAGGESTGNRNSMRPPPPRDGCCGGGDVGGNDADADASSSSAAMVFRRRRSVSNPEGMEKWDRRHFVLPASILEEELAEVSAAVKQQQMEQQLMELQQQRLKSTTNQSNGNDNGNNRNDPSPVQRSSIPEHEEFAGGVGGARGGVSSSPATKLAASAHEEMHSEKGNREGAKDSAEDDEGNELPPDELLRRARSRLLEDLLEGRMNNGGGDGKNPGAGGGLVLPHSLEKYKEVYNKNGRIGIYTPAERAAIIAKFNRKRTRRVWNKKIRYNCRKSLADRRLRVKGRFVKRSEQEELAAAKQQGDDPNTNSKADCCVGDNEKCSSDKPAEDDAEMPDVNDPDAGFSTTDDQPYRRTRRYTIT